MQNLKISLEAARVNSRLKQREVAEIMGVSRWTIINWEKGKTKIGVAEFKMMCEIYKIPMDFIYLPYNSTASRVS